MIEDFYLFFLSSTWENIISILKITCFLAIFLFLLAIVWVLKRSTWLYWRITEDLKDFKEGTPVPLLKKTQEGWCKIKRRLSSKKEANWKLAVMEGGGIVEDILLKIGYKEKDMRSRLSLATEAQIPNLRDLLGAAEIYSSILADSDYKITRKKAEEVLDVFEKFLRYFEYL